MVKLARAWSTLLFALAFSVIPAAAAAAQDGAAQPDGRACAATGYLAGSEAELAALRARLSGEPVHLVNGAPLERTGTWTIPADRLPVVVVDAPDQVSGAEVRVTVAGVTYPAVSEDFAQPQDRYVSNVVLPQLGPVVRTAGLTVAAGSCEASVKLRVDRPLWSTWVGVAAVLASAVAGVFTVLVARWRSGGWARRFGWAAPLGLVAGATQVVVWYEAGLRSPFAAFPWWLPLAGLGLSALLPLTRRRAQPGPGATGVWAAPSHASFADLTPVGGFARTEVAEVHRVVSPDGRPALAKVSVAGRQQDLATRLRLAREARLLSDLDHPNLPRLRQTLPGAAGPGGAAGEVGAGSPTLIFESVTGPPLPNLPGELSGPQAVTVALAVLAGLGALHARELVHRDVRPENIWLDQEHDVVLANLEVAAPGVEHPVAPEGGPFASPEQRRGEDLDGRSDLWSVAAVLRALLPAPPAPVAAVLSRALAEDRRARPDSAERFAAELRQAAEAAYGPDWVSRGALAAVLTTPGAVSAAAAGYATAGAAGAGGAAGMAGAGGAAAGLGSAAGSTAGLGAAVSGGVAGATGKVSALVNSGIAVAVGAAVVAGAVVVDAPPVAAQTTVVTPEQARVIVVRTLQEGRAGRYDHVQPGGPRDALGALVDEHDQLATAPVTAVEVGVPAAQYAFPAYFVATGEISYDGGLVSLFVRFDRPAADQPWLLTVLLWSVDEVLAAPLVDGDGWLPPAPAEFSIEPEELASGYVDWHDRRWTLHSDHHPEEAADERYRLREDAASYLISLFEWNETARLSGGEMELPPSSVPADRVEDGRRIFSYTAVSEVFPEPAQVSALPLADGTVLVSFLLTAHRTTYNAEETSGPCDVRPYIDLDGVRYRALAVDYQIRILAWVPAAGGETATVPIADPVVSTVVPSDRSVRC